MLIFLPSQAGLSCKPVLGLPRTLMEKLLQLDLYVKVFYEFVPFGSPADVLTVIVLEYQSVVSLLSLSTHVAQWIQSSIPLLPLKVKELVSQLYLTLQPHGRQPTRLLSPWNSPGKNTGVGCCSFLQGIFPSFPPKCFSLVQLVHSLNSKLRGPFKESWSPCLRSWQPPLLECFPHFF